MDRNGLWWLCGCISHALRLVLLCVLALAGCTGSGGGSGGSGGGSDSDTCTTVSGTSGTWVAEALTAMPTARHAFALVAVDCVLYAIGGNVDRSAIDTVEAFDPTANNGKGAWSSRPAMPTARHSLTAAAVDGIIYAIGGSTNDTTVEAFDPTGNSGEGSWSTKAEMPTGRKGLASAVVGGIIYAIGGSSGQTVEAFDPTGNAGLGAWSSMTDMPSGRNELTAQAVDGIIYAIGGQSGCEGLDTVEAFDPTGSKGLGAWSSKTAMPTGRKALASARVGGTIFAIGGIDSCDGGILLKTVEAFDPTGNSGEGSWSTKADMATARQSLASAAVNGVIYAVGGNADTGSPEELNTVEAFVP